MWLQRPLMCHSLHQASPWCGRLRDRSVSGTTAVVQQGIPPRQQLSSASTTFGTRYFIEIIVTHINNNEYNQEYVYKDKSVQLRICTLHGIFQKCVVTRHKLYLIQYFLGRLSRPDIGISNHKRLLPHAW